MSIFESLVELPDDIYEQIEILSEAGNEACDAGDYDTAIIQWRQALSLLPDPVDQWEAAMWLNASIADACYLSGDYPGAKNALHDALNGPDGNASSFVHYLLGKTLTKLDDSTGVDALLKAYMLEGADIFDADEEEGPDMLQILQDRGLVDE